MKFRYLSLVLLLTVSTLSAQNDIFKTTSKYWEITNPLNQQINEVSNSNTILKWTASHASMHSIYLMGESKREHQQVSLQNGDRYYNYSVNATSQLMLNNHTLIWGNASYHNGKTKNVLFNDNVDYNLIYPYVIADTKGGEMKSERYKFNGGYLRHFKSDIVFSAELSFRAVNSYRQTDPRPKNIVSDLEFKLGLGHTFSTNYLFGLNLSAQKYKQENSIIFMSDTKRIPLFHLSGLGNRMNKFDGSYAVTHHDGHSFGLNLGVNHLKNRGWLANIEYRYLMIEKIMDSLNDLSLQKIKEHKLDVKLGYTQDTWSVLAFINSKERKGYENLFGAPQNGRYKVLTTIQPYSHRETNLGIKSIYKMGWSNFTMYITPKVCYLNNLEKYTDSNSKIEENNLISRLTLTEYYKTKRWGNFTLKQNLLYAANLSKDFNISIDDTNPIKPLTDNLLSYLGKNKMAGRASVRWDLPFQISSINWFTEIAWETTHISGFKPIQYGEVKVGLIF